MDKKIKLLEFSKEELYKYYDLNCNKKVGDILSNEIKYFSFPLSNNIKLLVLEIDNKIAGVCQLLELEKKDIIEEDFYENSNEEIYSISFLTIHNDFKGNGYSKKILEHIFNMDIVKKSKFLYCSYFSEEGSIKLRKNLLEISKNNGIDVYISREGFFNFSNVRNNNSIILNKRSKLF